MFLEAKYTEKDEIDCYVKSIFFTRYNWEEVKRFTNNQVKDLMIEKCINGKAYCTLCKDGKEYIITEGDLLIKSKGKISCVKISLDTGISVYKTKEKTNEK